MNTAITYTEKFEQTLREIDQAVASKVESLTTDPFNLGKSILFAVDYVRGEVPAIKNIDEQGDIYEMLDDTLNAVRLFSIRTP